MPCNKLHGYLQKAFDLLQKYVNVTNKLIHVHCYSRRLITFQPLHHNYHSFLYPLVSPKLWCFKFDIVCLQMADKCNLRSVCLDSTIHPRNMY